MTKNGRCRTLAKITRTIARGDQGPFVARRPALWRCGAMKEKGGSLKAKIASYDEGCRASPCANAVPLSPDEVPWQGTNRSPSIRRLGRGSQQGPPATRKWRTDHGEGVEHDICSNGCGSFDDRPAAASNRSAAGCGQLSGSVAPDQEGSLVRFEAADSTCTTAPGTRLSRSKPCWTIASAIRLDEALAGRTIDRCNGRRKPIKGPPATQKRRRQNRKTLGPWPRARPRI